MRLALIICTMLCVCAPATPAGAYEAAHADWRIAVALAVKSSLKDPDSAKIRVAAYRKASISCGWVNARNSYGGYTGEQPFIAVVDLARPDSAVAGQYIAFAVSVGGDRIDQQVTASQCAKEGFTLEELRDAPSVDLNAPS